MLIIDGGAVRVGEYEVGASVKSVVPLKASLNIGSCRNVDN